MFDYEYTIYSISGFCASYILEWLNCGLLTNIWDTYIDPSKFNTVNYLYELIIELYVKW